jgi:hypothetical protein
MVTWLQCNGLTCMPLAVVCACIAATKGSNDPRVIMSRFAEATLFLLNLFCRQEGTWSADGSTRDLIGARAATSLGVDEVEFAFHSDAFGWLRRALAPGSHMTSKELRRVLMMGPTDVWKVCDELRKDKWKHVESAASINLSSLRAQVGRSLPVSFGFGVYSLTFCLPHCRRVRVAPCAP